jgi:NAD(P)-dependent dehydrogenase (short-subunit alcohol dehydrogenase family)
MAVNATGVFFGIKYAIPAMVANGGGSIVNLSSIAGIIGSEHVHMAYNASKAAVRLMTKSVAVQHAKDKIRANSVHPGIMPPMRTSGRTAEPAVRAERMRVIPMRRPGEVDEVAYAILFLASDESSYITGSEIHVDGGARWRWHKILKFRKTAGGSRMAGLPGKGSRRRDAGPTLL